ncbi:MAG TPA: hypothetical protein VM260_22490, partial [Pirellula sp.]|nr:hypothetical protein [Pirellula sp.]
IGIAWLLALLTPDQVSTCRLSVSDSPSHLPNGLATRTQTNYFDSWMFQPTTSQLRSVQNQVSPFLDAATSRDPIKPDDDRTRPVIPSPAEPPAIRTTSLNDYVRALLRRRRIVDLEVPSINPFNNMPQRFAAQTVGRRMWR